MLKGKNLILRAPEPSDLDMMMQWENDPRIWNITGTHIPFSKSALEKYLNAVHDIYTDKQYRFVACLQEGLIPVGMIDLFDFDPYHLRAGVGILVGNENDRGKGWGTEMLSLLIAYARQHLGLRNLFCHVLCNNETSKRLFTTAGFTRAGELRNWHREDTQWLDEYVYVLSIN